MGLSVTIKVGTGARERSSIFKTAMLSQLEQVKSCVSINKSTVLYHLAYSKT